MKDETKRKIIHFLNRFDSPTGKPIRTSGWGSKNRCIWFAPTYNKHDDEGELRELTGKELNRELRTQILFTLPIFLFYVFLVFVFVWLLFW